MTPSAEVQILAHHGLWLALPAFAPAIVVAGVVIYIASKNRRAPDSKSSDTPGHNTRP